MTLSEDSSTPDGAPRRPAAASAAISAAGSPTQARHFDHIYLLVSSLTDGSQFIEHCGFRATPVGYHGSGLGTANTTIMMPDGRTYFELLTVTEPTSVNADKRQALAERGNHMAGIAFDWPVDEAYLTFAGAKLDDGAPFHFQRPVDLPDGPKDAHFDVAMTRAEALPAARLFAITHHSREIVWRPDYLSHPNGATAITALIGTCADPKTVFSSWSRLLDGQVVEDAGGVHIRTGTATIVFLTPDAYRARYGRTSHSDPVGLDVIEVTVRDLALCARHLEANGVSFFEPPAGGILTVHEPAIGASVHFVEARNDW